MQNTELKVWGPKPVYSIYPPDKRFGELGRQRYYKERIELVTHGNQARESGT